MTVLVPGGLSAPFCPRKVSGAGLGFLGRTGLWSRGCLSGQTVKSWVPGAVPVRLTSGGSLGGGEEWRQLPVLAAPPGALVPAGVRGWRQRPMTRCDGHASCVCSKWASWPSWMTRRVVVVTTTASRLSLQSLSFCSHQELRTHAPPAPPPDGAARAQRPHRETLAG